MDMLGGPRNQVTISALIFGGSYVWCPPQDGGYVTGSQFSLGFGAPFIFVGYDTGETEIFPINQ